MGREGTMPLVWYDIKKDQLGTSWELDGCFYALIPGVDWSRYLLLGPLGNPSDE